MDKVYLVKNREGAVITRHPREEDTIIIGFKMSGIPFPSDPVLYDRDIHGSLPDDHTLVGYLVQGMIVGMGGTLVFQG